MADHTAYPDRIDCRDLRAADETAGDGDHRTGLNAGAWRSALRLIDPPDRGAEAAAREEQARREAEERAQAERRKAEADARAEAEAARAAAKAQAKARAEAEARAKAEALARAKAEAGERARAAKEAREQARREAEARALAAREERERAAAEARARKREEAEARARAEAEAKARAEADAKARKEAEARARAEAAALAKAKAEEEARAKAEAKARAKAEAEERAREEARLAAEAKAKALAEERARREELARKKAEAKAAAAAAAEARRIAAAEAKARAEEEARLAAEAAAKAAAEERARAEAEAAARAAAEEEARLAAEAEAQARAAAEEEARIAAETEAKARAAAEEQERLEAELAARAQVDVAATLKRLIRQTGPISLAHYMGESNARYYASRDPLGEQGDFVTAPEVSQMFGELIGLWLADLWVRMGSRKHIHYVELGPGRGTLAKDALGAAARYDFAPQIHFVETSATLRRIQREAFPGCHHHHDLATLPDDAPLLIVANEFFDALPIHQLVRSADGWFERMVGLDGEAFTFATGRERMDHIVPPSWTSAAQGAMIETSPASVAVMGEIARRLREQGGAALIVDYGHLELRSGSTLQALRNHEKVDVFAHPGEADITAHVDFELLAHVAREQGADVMGIQMQGEWLRQMGIDTRLEALQRRNPREGQKLKRQYDRLVSDNQMGTLFKVLGICGRRWPFGVGFE